MDSEMRRHMAWLQDRGVARVEVGFSGGNDEGGVDYLVCYDADGEEVEDLFGPELHITTRGWEDGKQITTEPMVHLYDWSTKPPTITERPATEDELRDAKIRKALAQPVFDKYYTFAGEFQVEGTVTWDVATGECELSGRETQWVEI